jgi:propanediol utilization protein
VYYSPEIAAPKGVAMILNKEQQMAVENGEPVTLNVAGTECVLVRRDVYLRLEPDYDTGAWTVEEMNLLADEAEAMISQRESHGH